MKKLRVTVEGKVYEVLVEILDEPKAAAPDQVPTSAPVVSASVSAPAIAHVAAPKPVVAGSGEVVSPLAGKVVSIDVTVGQVVTEGQQVATIEAMKMNTYIYAPKAGAVASITANPGDGVAEGGPLLTIS